MILKKERKSISESLATIFNINHDNFEQWTQNEELHNKDISKD